MPYLHRLPALSLLTASLFLSACTGGDDTSETPPDPVPETPERGDLSEDPPEHLASLSPGDLIALLSTNELAQVAVEVILTPECTVEVYHLKYQTVDPSGSITPASGALMAPTGSATCQGARPLLLYAHGTSTDKSYNIADVRNPDNGEGLLLAAVFAAQGYIVVAPNYVGYDISVLDYHPYLNGEQQSNDMIDALAAARSALPAAQAPNTTDAGTLFVTGYSQGGFVAMATHRALQEAGQPVTASAPMSGPYALAAFGDAIFQGQVTASAPVNLTLLLSSYQRAYGNLYNQTTEAFEPQYATGIETLLPSTTSIGDLRDQGRFPASALFDSTPPDAAFASMTPATQPADLAPVFAQGFGADHLLTNAFRLAYLQDAQTHPDGGFPTLIDGRPPATPAHPLRQALKINDQRNWTPTSPMLLCAGADDPTVLYLNTELMQNFWASSTTVTILNIDSGATIGDPYASQKNQFFIAKNLLELTEGDQAVLDAYHTSLVAPFCLDAVKSFFDRQ